MILLTCVCVGGGGGGGFSVGKIFATMLLYFVIPFNYDYIASI